MKITPVKIAVAALLIGFAVPLKTGRALPETPRDEFVKEVRVQRPYEETLLDDLNEVEEVNFRGGVIYKYDEKSVAVLKERLMNDTGKVEYRLPIENKKNVYLDKFGMFMTPRTQGRPHLGLDIFVTPYARKPAVPVLIQSPIDGVVISEKHAREQDNVIANSITILGKDGRRYAFEHMARASDYPKHKAVPLPALGTYLHAGDAIGYVGSTGETTMWHLHFAVMTDEQLSKQKSSKEWREIQANSPYSALRGQVNPMDVSQAGPVAELLRAYRH